jgi:hypothetical protein
MASGEPPHTASGKPQYIAKEGDKMNIALTGRTAKPRVINVKQYSGGVDSITFTIKDSLPTGKVKGYMISDKYRQDIDFTASDTGGTAQWYIADTFTSESGTYDIQLELTNGTAVWRSDVMLLIVSESTNGSEGVTTTPGTSTDSGDYQTIYAKIRAYEDSFKNKKLSERVFSDGVVFVV